MSYRRFPEGRPGLLFEKVTFGRKNMDQLTAWAVIRQLIDNIFTWDIKSTVEVCMRVGGGGDRPALYVSKQLHVHSRGH